MKKRPGILAWLSLALVLMFAACGGRQSVASRSAAAYDEATRKGIPIGGAHEHGGHSATNSEGSEMPGMGHSTMQGGTMTAMDHSKMQSGSLPGMGHSKMQDGSMPGMDHSKMQDGSMPGMDHSKMQSGSTSGMDHSKMRPGSTSGMDHSKMQDSSTPGMDHSKMQSGSMPGMDHSKKQSGSMAGMQHGSATAALPTPLSATDIRDIDPAATLASDPFDAPSPVSVSEAVKAANNVPDGDIRHIVPGQDHENPPTPQPAFRGGIVPAGHAQHGRTTSAPATAAPDPTAQGDSTSTSASQKPVEITVYTCPMHPEVTSDKPGACPKCGMALVKEN